MKVKATLKKHKFDITLSIVTMVIGAILGGAFGYYAGEQNQKMTDSGIIALADQQAALHNGLSASVVQLPNGNFSDAYGIHLNATVQIGASLEVAVGCNNGITYYNITGPFSCPAPLY